MKNIWAKEIWRKGWGLWVRVRVTLRKQLKRDPYHAEFQAALKSEKDYRDITPDDIKAAYDSGQEVGLCSAFDLVIAGSLFYQTAAWSAHPQVHWVRRGLSTRNPYTVPSLGSTTSEAQRPEEED